MVYHSYNFYIVVLRPYGPFHETVFIAIKIWWKIVVNFITAHQIDIDICICHNITGQNQALIKPVLPILGHMQAQ